MSRSASVWTSPAACFSDDSPNPHTKRPPARH